MQVFICWIYYLPVQFHCRFLFFFFFPFNFSFFLIFLSSDHILHNWVKRAISGTYRLVFEVKKLTQLSSPFDMEVLAAAASAGAVETYKDVRNAVDSLDELRDYEKNLDKNYEKLKDEAKKLYARRSDLLVKINRDRTKQTTEECNVWMGKVKKLEKDVLALESEYEEEKRYQFKLLRLLPRSNLSKCMVEKRIDIQSCWSEGSNFVTDFLVERSAKPIKKLKAPKIKDMPSLYVIFEDILQCLKDSCVTRIGLWGRVGVGKTTIMQNLNDSEEISKLFDIVFYVNLADEGNEEKLQERVQHQIAQKLQLNSLQDRTDTKTIASRVSEKLESMRFLLLLDDVWGPFDLDDCGISENGRDSKIVIASRHRGHCREMGVDHLIRVSRLSNDEAWNLFQERLGRTLNSEFKALGLQVIEECDNLPLLIDKVARAFRRKDNILLWEAGLNKLRIWPCTKCDGMDDVFDLLRFCYEELDEDEKFCFLYGALYTEAYEICIKYLLEC
uniref:NB-ARC domain-containing protein n=2 Tax=Manihot esculenta TaxID=3983 RepID=A0A2C9V5F6_MANES